MKIAGDPMLLRGRKGVGNEIDNRSGGVQWYPLKEEKGESYLEGNSQQRAESPGIDCKQQRRAPGRDRKQKS